MKSGFLSVILFLLSIFVAPFVAAQGDCGTTAECEPHGLSETEISAYPEPNVRPLYPDDALLFDRVYREVEGELGMHDAPNGNLVSTLGDGFNYVTLLREQNGWAETSPNKWVRSELLNEDVPVSRFAGVRLPEEGLTYPMAWALVHLYPSLEPGGEANEEYPMIWRYTRMNIYATVEVDGLNWYQIGVDKWVHQYRVAKIIPVERPADVDTHYWVSVDLYEQVIIAYEGTTPVFATLVSSGLSEWSTDEGLFHIYLRYPRTLMSGANGQTDFYYLEEVPWTMYFNDDMALHGTYWHDGFGFRQSHGCVNLSITDAHWLYEWATEAFNAEDVDETDEIDETGVAVYVYSSGDYR